MEELVVNVQDIPEAKIFVKDNTVFVDTVEYTLIENYKNAFSSDSFQDRYTKLLQKYHYIVGDWGHEQLRLKGFYEVGHKSEATINTLQDYLREYCSFGCAYFVLKINGEPVPFTEDDAARPSQNKSRRRRPFKQKSKDMRDKNSNREVTTEKTKRNEEKVQTDTKTRSQAKPKKKHGFVIRKQDKKERA